MNGRPDELFVSAISLATIQVLIDDAQKDVGFGLRLGKTRMGGGVVHIDLAFPLDGEDDIDDVQLLFKVKRSF